MGLLFGGVMVVVVVTGLGRGRSEGGLDFSFGEVGVLCRKQKKGYGCREGSS